MVKHSRQREAIVTYLKSRTDHPTAEQVYEYVRNLYPNISKGTVYRNLTLLCDLKEIMKVVPENADADHFDYNTSPHQHFCCRRCGAVRDVFLKDSASVRREAELQLKARIDEEKTIFYGICADCLADEKNSENA